jgi:predicted GIY-YIG superfamily endonuclease
MAVYLLHFVRPVRDGHPAQHYLGYTSSLERRILEHASGHGAAITRAAHKRGIKFELARVWAGGDKELERDIRCQHNNPRYCPICNAR